MGLNQLIDQYIGIIKKFFKGSRLHKLRRRRQNVLDEIAITEKKWLKRAIDKKAFRELNEKFHKELITLEAGIEVEKIEERLKKFTEKEAEKLSRKRKPALKKLLGKKQKMLKELDRAKKLYLKRSIDEKSYRSIVKEKQEKLISIEAGITCLYRDEAREVMEETEKKLSITEEEALKDDAAQIAEDIVEQVSPEIERGRTGKIKRRERRRFRRER